LAFVRQRSNSGKSTKIVATWILELSGMSSSVVSLEYADVSEVRTASIIRAIYVDYNLFISCVLSNRLTF
jgi:hypothetical protein